ncbi:hypothetical protein BGW38_004363 [Lunasporangiospora selenospora]|uniref:Uncharacterized protein n=1 Tax=Lunasporangiospora selenospora TaxID=979761 RepID=A0A9P6KIZ1_9FUNG|nr:hypothetical protein BGW38_004363 [Lunasporangiospora selenospora]
MEVKMLNKHKDDIEDDTRKLLYTMKIALNMLIHANVQYATVIGFLVDGIYCGKCTISTMYAKNICEVFTMNLEHEAIYIPKSIGQFKLPRDRLDIPALLLALGPLIAVKASVSSIIHVVCLYFFSVKCDF